MIPKLLMQFVISIKLENGYSEVVRCSLEPDLCHGRRRNRLYIVCHILVEQYVSQINRPWAYSIDFGSRQRKGMEEQAPVPEFVQ